MSESEQADFDKKMWRLLNLQADAALKLAQQTHYEPWKVVVSGMTAGAALVAGTAAIFKLFS